MRQNNIAPNEKHHHALTPDPLTELIRQGALADGQGTGLFFLRIPR